MLVRAIDFHNVLRKLLIKFPLPNFKVRFKRGLSIYITVRKSLCSHFKAHTMCYELRIYYRAYLGLQ